MKHIKLFEEIKKHIPKFKKDTPVKIIGDKTNTIYIIDEYEYRKKQNIKDVCRLRKYVDKNKLASYEGFFIWINESDLIEAEQYEIDAIKYNI